MLYLSAHQGRLLQPERRLLMAERMTSQLAVDALANAVALGRPTATVSIHQAWSVQLPGLRPRPCVTMAWPGRWAGSEPVPTRPPWTFFFSLLQTNVHNRRRWTTREQRRLAIIVWIEPHLHRRCRQDHFGRHAASSPRPAGRSG